MHPARRAAFVYSGDFSHINRMFLESLRAEFPDYTFDTFDVDALDVWRRSRLPWRAYCSLREYGLKGGDSVASIRRYALHTPQFFAAVSRELQARLGSKRYAFTIQTQSLFDASQPGVPNFVYTDHTHLTNLYYPGFDRAGLYSRAWIECERTIYNNAHAVFTMSSHVSRSLSEHYACSSAKVECVYIGSNIDAPREALFVDSRHSSKDILFVGVDWERKGGPQLVEAFKLVLKKHPDARLTVVGCSPRLEVPNCRVLGRLSLVEISRHYLAAAVFCLPTRIEPFGIVFLEAYAHRLPVVATRIGALPDLVIDGETGFLVEPDDIATLAERLIAILDDPSLGKKMGAAGLRHTSGRYTWRSTVQRVGARIRNELTVLPPAESKERIA